MKNKKDETEIEYNERLIKLWEDKKINIEKDTYNQNPTFGSNYTKKEKIDYCNNMINRIKFDLDKIPT